MIWMPTSVSTNVGLKRWPVSRCPNRPSSSKPHVNTLPFKSITPRGAGKKSNTMPYSNQAKQDRTSVMTATGDIFDVLKIQFLRKHLICLISVPQATVLSESPRVHLSRSSQSSLEIMGLTKEHQVDRQRYPYRMQASAGYLADFNTCQPLHL